MHEGAGVRPLALAGGRPWTDLELAVWVSNCHAPCLLYVAGRFKQCGHEPDQVTFHPPAVGSRALPALALEVVVYSEYIFEGRQIQADDLRFPNARVLEQVVYLRQVLRYSRPSRRTHLDHRPIRKSFFPDRRCRVLLYGLSRRRGRVPQRGYVRVSARSSLWLAQAFIRGMRRTPRVAGD